MKNDIVAARNYAPGRGCSISKWTFWLHIKMEIRPQQWICDNKTAACAFYRHRERRHIWGVACTCGLSPIDCHLGIELPMIQSSFDPEQHAGPLPCRKPAVCIGKHRSRTNLHGCLTGKHPRHRLQPAPQAAGGRSGKRSEVWAENAVWTECSVNARMYVVVVYVKIQSRSSQDPVKIHSRSSENPVKVKIQS